MPIVETQTDPLDELRARKAEIDKAEYARASVMDRQEEAERTEAAQRITVENEKMVVDYAADCARSSIAATEEMRKQQDHCWRVYQEDEPVAYGNKEAWQSRVIVPKPFATVQTGAAVIKKAFSPDFLSIKDELSESAKEFWKIVLDIQNDDQHGNFVTAITDASIMALAVGISQEIIPRWIPGKGLQYSLVEPWKILRDPDAPRRDPQGGLYWIHREWLDWHVLRAGETAGKYFDVERVRSTTESGADPSDPFMSKDAIEERKKQIFTRSDFRKMHLVEEFYGMILDSKGEVILPRAQFTVCGGRVIELPKTVPYSRLRWPGVSFSPFPSLLSYGGRGLLKGIISVWETMCNLQCLFEDALKWLVNPSKEVCVDQLVDPRDVEDWPGKKYLVRESINGQQTVRESQRRDMTSSILANQQYHDQLFQRGSFITDAVQGLPGYRKDMTWRESQQMLDQGLGVFQLIGQNVEAGAIAVLAASQDVIETFAGYSDYEKMFGRVPLEKMMVAPDARRPNGVNGLPALSGRFHVSGVSSLMKSAETLQHLTQVFMPLMANPEFSIYLKPYQMLKALETRTSLTDEGIISSEEEAMQIDLARKQMNEEQAQKIDAQEKSAEEAQGIGQVSQLVGLLRDIGGIGEEGKAEGGRLKAEGKSKKKESGAK
jgi:hypothetical protein